MDKEKAMRIIMDLQDVFDFHPYLQWEVKSIERYLMKAHNITDQDLINYSIEN